MTLPRKFCYCLTLTSYFLLLALLLLWPTVLSPPKHIPTAVILIVSVLPLLFPLMGLLHGRRNAYVWAGYLSLFYFIHAVTEAAAVHQFTEMMAVGSELVASSLLFIGSILYLKSSKLA